MVFTLLLFINSLPLSLFWSSLNAAAAAAAAACLSFSVIDARRKLVERG